ncbi:MAG: TIGR03560 family F420-dependent LLM class oxidoreductase [Chloroflexota bacterium]
MQFGLQINPYYPGKTGNPWDSVERVSKLADKSRLDSVWVYDHFLYEGGYPGHPISEPAMECFTMLGAIAAATTRVRMGQLVIGIPYRNPAMTAKMAVTLDHISRGRSILGIGAGWHQREYEAYGWGEFEPLGVRMKRLEEAVRAMIALWTENPTSFKGDFYSLDNVRENPMAIQKPHPPIMIGGSGERVTMRLVAQYAQMCNVQGEPESVQRLFGTIKENCERIGRPYEQITRTMYSSIFIGRNEAEVAKKREALADYIPRRGSMIGTPAQIIDMIGAYAKIGAQYLVFRMPDWIDEDPVQLFSEEVIPALENV